MPGPSRKTKRKPGSVPTAGPSSNAASTSRSNVYESFFADIDHSQSWDYIASTICDHLGIDLETKHGLKKVHSNFENIYSKLDKIYVANVTKNEKMAGGVVSVQSKMCVGQLHHLSACMLWTCLTFCRCNFKE